MNSTADSWVNSELSAGRYRVVAELGAGGMGQVYRAWDANLETDVVIKVPHAGLSEDVEFADRFTREIRSLVQLSHPHIVKVIDVGERDDRPFAVMQYLSGGSLEDQRRLDQQGNPIPCAPRQLATWLSDIANSLDFVHERGYVHRDVKPANILFDEHGHAYLSDFGIAKVVLAATKEDEALSRTGTGLVLGTPHYMAPELIMGEKCDGRVDQYALGVLVYELLCGRMPIDGPTAGAVMVQHTTQKPVAPSSIIAELPLPISAAIERSLAKASDQRFSTCVEFAQTVLEPIQHMKEAPPPKAQQQKREGEETPAGIPCPTCGTTLLVLAKHAGRKVSCPRCKSRFRVSNNLQGIKQLADKQTQAATHNKAQVEQQTVMVSSLPSQASPDTDARHAPFDTTQHLQQGHIAPSEPFLRVDSDKLKLDGSAFAQRHTLISRMRSKPALFATLLSLAVIFSIMAVSVYSWSSNTQAQPGASNEDDFSVLQDPSSPLDVASPNPSQSSPRVAGNVDQPATGDAEPQAPPSSQSEHPPTTDQLTGAEPLPESTAGGNADSSPPTMPLEAQPPSNVPDASPQFPESSRLALLLEVELPKNDMIHEDKQGESVSLGVVPENMIDELHLDLDSKYVDFGGQFSFELRPVEKSVGQWEVMMNENKAADEATPEAEDAGIDLEQPLAFIAPIDEELTFNWNSQNTWAFGENRDKRFAGQLSNCILLVEHSGEEHSIRLRPLQKTPPLILTFEKKREQTEVELSDLPPQETLALKIIELKNFNVPTEMDPGDGRIGLDKRGRIEIFVGDSQHIRIRFDAELNESGVEISISSHFKSGETYKLLTEKDAQQELTLKKRQLSKGKEELDVAKRILANALAVRNGLGPAPHNANQRIWSQKLGRANSDIDNSNATIKRYTTQTANAQTTIEELQKMGKIATALQNNAAIVYQITSTVDQEERPLLIANQKLPKNGTVGSMSRTRAHGIHDDIGLASLLGRPDSYIKTD